MVTPEMGTAMPTVDPQPPAGKFASSAFRRRQPQDNVGIALSGPPYSPEPVDYRRLHPCQALALRGDFGLVGDRAQREGGGYRLEGGFGEASIKPESVAEKIAIERMVPFAPIAYR